MTNDRGQRRLYGDLAWTWPMISPPDHYIGESEAVAALIRAHAAGFEVRIVADTDPDGNDEPFPAFVGVKPGGVAVKPPGRAGLPSTPRSPSAWC